MKPESGFTLVEIMVAMAIVGMLAAIAIPNYTQWDTRNRLHQTTSELASQLTLARMMAMNRSKSVDVTIQDNDTSLPIQSRFVTVEAVLSSTATSPTPTVLLSKRIEYVGSTVLDGPVTVSFSAMGRRTSAGTAVQTIGLCNPDKLQYSVTIIPVGKVNWATNPSGTACP